MARKKNHLPKRIAGLKVPKSIRRGPLGAFITSVAGQAIIAALILKAGERLKDEVTGADPGANGPADRAAAAFAEGRPADGRGPNAAEAAGAAHDATLNIKHALLEGARHFFLGLSHPKKGKKHRRHAAPAAPEYYPPAEPDRPSGRAFPSPLAGKGGP